MKLAQQESRRKKALKKVFETKPQPTDGKWVKVDSKTMKFVKN